MRSSVGHPNGRHAARAVRWNWSRHFFAASSSIRLIMRSSRTRCDRHAHPMEYWNLTPRIAFMSPSPESRKTRALEVTELLAPYPKVLTASRPRQR